MRTRTRSLNHHRLFQMFGVRHLRLIRTTLMVTRSILPHSEDPQSRECPSLLQSHFLLLEWILRQPSTSVEGERKARRIKQNFHPEWINYIL